VPLVYGSERNLITVYYEKDKKRAMIDGAFTRLYHRCNASFFDRFASSCQCLMRVLPLLTTDGANAPARSDSSRTVLLGLQTAKAVCTGREPSSKAHVWFAADMECSCLSCREL
jgi:hypothetical protein